MTISFKKWFESFIYQSMTDPFTEREPSGSEISADPYFRPSDLPPTKKNKPRKSRLAIPKK